MVGTPCLERRVISLKLLPPKLNTCAWSGKLAPALSTKLMPGKLFSAPISAMRNAFFKDAISIAPPLLVPTFAVIKHIFPETKPIPATMVPPVPKPPFTPKPARGHNSKNGESWSSNKSMRSLAKNFPPAFALAICFSSP